MHRLLHGNFFGSFDIEGVADDYKGNFTLHYYKNGELLYFYRYKNSKLFERKILIGKKSIEEFSNIMIIIKFQLFIINPVKFLLDILFLITTLIYQKVQAI